MMLYDALPLSISYEACAMHILTTDGLILSFFASQWRPISQAVQRGLVTARG